MKRLACVFVALFVASSAQAQTTVTTQGIAAAGIDTCAEFAAIMGGETGTCGQIVLSTSPEFITSILSATAGNADLGSATKPFKDLFLAGSSGTPGTNNFRFTGASTSGTRLITFPDESMTVAGRGANTLTGAQTLTDSGMGGSTVLSYPTNAELVMTASNDNLNVLVLRNNSVTNSFSAVAFRANDGIERGAVGWGNSTAGAPFANSTYIEASYFPVSGTNPPAPFKIVQTGYMNGSNGTRLRTNYADDGFIHFYKLDGSTVQFTIDSANGRTGILAAAPVNELDVIGHSIIGSAPSSRAADATAALTISDASDLPLRLIKTGIVKVDFKIQGTGASRRLDFMDTDNSAVIPFSVRLNGTRGVGVGMLAYDTLQAPVVDGTTTFAITSSFAVIACTGAETINTITGGTTGMTLVLINSDADCTLADDDDPTAANALNLTGTATSDIGAAGKVITLIYDGASWLQVTESAN